MHLIVGLGNPTKQYEGTRHNVGFETIDRIAAENQIRVEEKKHKALYGSGYIEGEKVILAKPQTFMFSAVKVSENCLITIRFLQRILL